MITRELRYNDALLVVRRCAIAIAIAIAFAVASLVFSSMAWANGRFPEAQMIASVPRSDGTTVFLRATFGVLVSRDRGASWRWICERALGYEGQWDPPITVTADGRLWVGLEDGLRSTIDGCDVAVVGELSGHTVKDLTTDARGEGVWAITGAPGKVGYVWRKRPGASRFERLASFPDTNLMTIDVAPSNPARVYVSGQAYTTIRGRIFRSDDGGATFRDDGAPPDAGAERRDGGHLDGGSASGKVTAASLVADGPFFLGAIDPVDPGRLLVRHLHGRGSDLLLSRDGGRSFENVLSMTSAMFGFARSADGKTVWAGSGLPEHGLFRSIDRGEHFTRVAPHGVLCLHAAPWGSLFFCENSLSRGAPAIAVAADERAGEGGITPLARFADVEGPVRCDDGGAHANLCMAGWPEILTQITLRDAASGADAAGRRGAEPSSDPPSPKCGCGVVGARTSIGEAVAVLLGLLLALGRRWGDPSLPPWIAEESPGGLTRRNSLQNDRCHP